MTTNNLSVTVACPGPVFSNLTSAAFTAKSGQVRHAAQCYYTVVHKNVPLLFLR